MATRMASSKYRTVAVLLALLVLHSALLAWSAVANSVTFDEYAHLPAGVSYWHSGRFDVYDLSPPLLRLLGSWPAVLAGAIALQRSSPSSPRLPIFATGTMPISSSGRIESIIKSSLSWAAWA